MKFDYYEFNGNILNLSISVGKLLGVVDSTFLRKPDTKLRKANKIRTIHSSLAIEGNTLSEEQIIALLENKRVLGPKKDILEVKNAIKAYDELKNYKYDNIKSYLKAHSEILRG